MLRPVLRNFVTYAGLAGLNMAVGLVSLPYLTRVLSPSDLGLIGLGLAVVSFLMPLGTVYTDLLASVSKAQLQPGPFVIFRNGALTFSAANHGLFAAVAAALAFILPGYAALIAFVPIYSFFRCLTAFHALEMIQEGRARQYGLLNLATSILALFLTIVLISGLGLSWEGRAAALIAAEALVVIVRYGIVSSGARTYRPEIAPGDVRRFLAFGLPLVIGLAAGWVMSNADRVITAKYFTLSDVGYYVVATRIGSVLSTLNQSLVNAIVPMIFRRLADGSGRRDIVLVHAGYGAFALALGLVIALLFSRFTTEVLGESFAGSAPVIAILAIAYGVEGLYKVPRGILTFYGMSVTQGVQLYVCAAANVGVALALIPSQGTLAPAFGTLAASGLMAVLATFSAYRRMAKGGGPLRVPAFEPPPDP